MALGSGGLGLSLYLVSLLPHSLEGPPSYKPPTPKAKLEEPEMVSSLPEPRAASPLPPAHLPPFPSKAMVGERVLGKGGGLGGVLTYPAPSHCSPPSSSLLGPQSTAHSRPPILMLASRVLSR